MVTLKNRRLLIDGKPVLIFAGEIHYFRLQRSEWPDRIQKLKELGCNAVATYIPWLVHEQVEGQFDVQAVVDFMDLCHAEGFWFLPRPGPFIMAETKNEGIPHWVYRKHPDAIPLSWNGEKAVTPTLNYLNEGFLAEVERWYGAIMPPIAASLQAKGGPVIGVQLDNEIGMLLWVTNQPDLSDETLCDFSRWVVQRYGADRYPFDLEDPFVRTKALREPAPEIGPMLLRDYGDYERDRFARYVATLRRFSEANGVKDVPFIVNVHGSGGGRGTAFPIGIHQLYESYGGKPGYLSGSDHYLGELTRENAPDLYFINAFMLAVAGPEQPISSMEFEVGTGDYGETGGVRMSGAAADMKARLSIAQGNRLLNYYLLSGGRNPMLDNPPADGNGRIAGTGERHGFAAPIGPEGDLDPTYYALARTTHSLAAIGPKLADMDEEHDDIALAFVPDYYKTDFHRPGPMRAIVESLEFIRGHLASLTRALLFLGYRFPAVDLQHSPVSAKTLVFASSRHLDESIQQKLVAFVEAGGRLLLYGELPHLDMEGRPCTVLAEAFGLRHAAFLQASHHYYLSLQAKGEPEIRVWRAESFSASRGDAFMKVVDTGTPVGVDVPLGRGRAVVIGCEYPFHPAFFRGVMDRLGARAALQHDAPGGGVLMTSVANASGERFLNLINLDHEAKTLHITENGLSLFGDERVHLPGRNSRMLPLNVTFGRITVVSSTTELMSSGPQFLRFRPSEKEEVVRHRRSVEPHSGGTPTVSRIASGETLDIWI